MHIFMNIHTVCIHSNVLGEKALLPYVGRGTRLIASRRLSTIAMFGHTILQFVIKSKTVPANVNLLQLASYVICYYINIISLCSGRERTSANVVEKKVGLHHT